LALVVEKRRVELKTTLGSTSFNVSHLCHNDKCSNTDHLVVESRQNNLRRVLCSKTIRETAVTKWPCCQATLRGSRPNVRSMWLASKPSLRTI
ncbi:hypothetical protein V1525DRAFT_348913, partial [Lipomyces kononenkoae]